MFFCKFTVLLFSFLKFNHHRILPVLQPNIYWKVRRVAPAQLKLNACRSAGRLGEQHRQSDVSLRSQEEREPIAALMWPVPPLIKEPFQSPSRVTLPPPPPPAHRPHMLRWLNWQESSALHIWLQIQEKLPGAQQTVSLSVRAEGWRNKIILGVTKSCQDPVSNIR